MCSSENKTGWHYASHTAGNSTENPHSHQSETKNLLFCQEVYSHNYVQLITKHKRSGVRQSVQQLG